MARRINTKFIFFLVLGLAVVGAAILLATMLKQEHPDQYINAGDQAMAHHQWTDAVADYGKAVKLDPRKPEYQMKLGGALEAAVNNDAENLNRARMAYEAALEIDTNYLPALKALIAWCQSPLRKPTPDVYRLLIDYARRASALEPSNKELAALPDISVVQESLANLQPDQREVDQALANLHKLMEQDPDDAEIPYNIAMAMIQKANDMLRQVSSSQEVPEATALYTQAKGIFDKIFSGPNGGPQDHNAMMHLHYAQVLAFESDANKGRPNFADYKTYLAKAQSEIESAQALVKEKDAQEYFAINIYAERFARGRGHADEALRILRAMPQTSVIVLSDEADILASSPDTVKQGIAILSDALKSFTTDNTQMDPIRFQLIKRLTDLRLTAYAHSKDPSEKQQLLDKIQSDLGVMQQQRGALNGREIKQLQARLLLIQGKDTEAVPILSKLVADDPEAARDINIRELLTEAYKMTHQTGKAADLLRGMVHDYPTEVSFQKELVQMLLKQNPALAGQQLDALEKLLPNDPEVILDRITVLNTDPEKNKDAIKSYFDRLPEGTPIELASKAQVALGLHDWPNTIRLLKAYLKTDPKNARDEGVLAEAYMSNGQKDEALQAANQALKDSPNDPNLKILLATLEGTDPKQIAKIREQLAAELPDPVDRDMNLAMFALEDGNLGEVEHYYKDAEKAAPDNAAVWSRLFQLYLNTKRFDDAAVYCDKLAKVNYDLAGGLLYRFQLAKARGDNDAALQLAKEVTEKDPDFAASWMALGQALQAMGQYDQAIAQYAVAVEKEGLNLQAVEGLIECSYALQKPGDALHWINDGLAKFPNDQTLHKQQLDYQLRYGSPGAAVDAMKAELDRSPNDPNMWALMGNTYLRTAQSAKMSNDDNDSQKLINLASTTLNQALTKWPDEQEIYLELANVAMFKGQINEARDIFLRWAARPKWKERIEPYTTLSEFYERIGQPDLSESAMNTAWEKSNYRVDIQIRLAAVLAAHRKYDEALKKLYSTNTDNLSVKRETVEVLGTSGRIDEAMSTLKGILDKNPPDRGDLLTLGAGILYNNKKFDTAIDYCNQALGIDSRNQVALYRRAVSKMEKSPSDLQGALDDLNSLYQMRPYSTEVRTTLANVEILLGKYDDATAQLESALRLAPSNKPIRMMLVQLYMSGTRVRFNDAMHLLTDVESTPPFNTDPEIFYREAQLLEDQHDYTDAIEKGRKAYELAPQSPELLQTYLELLLRTEAFQDVVDKTNSLAASNKEIWWLMLYRGVAQVHLKNLTEGESDLNQALADAQKANDLAATSQVGQAYAHEIGVDKAITSMTPYAKNQLSAKLVLAMLLTRKGDDAGAVKLMDEVLAAAGQLNESDKFTAYSTAAGVYAAVKPQPMVDKAYDAYQNALKIHPEDMKTLNDLAFLLVDESKPPRIPEALEYAKKAVDSMHKSGRTNSMILDTLGWVQVEAGSLDEGISNLREAVDALPEPEFYFHLGEAYLRQSNVNTALKEAQLGLKMLNSSANAQDENAVTLRSKLAGLIARCQERITKTSPQTQPQ